LTACGACAFTGERNSFPILKRFENTSHAHRVRGQYLSWRSVPRGEFVAGFYIGSDYPDAFAIEDQKALEAILAESFD
jgi:hypothetical protein